MRDYWEEGGYRPKNERKEWLIVRIIKKIFGRNYHVYKMDI
jgi:hypothetical protein